MEQHSVRNLQRETLKTIFDTFDLLQYFLHIFFSFLFFLLFSYNSSFLKILMKILILFFNFQCSKCANLKNVLKYNNCQNTSKNCFWMKLFFLMQCSFRTKANKFSTDWFLLIICEFPTLLGGEIKVSSIPSLQFWIQRNSSFRLYATQA